MLVKNLELTGNTRMLVRHGKRGAAPCLPKRCQKTRCQSAVTPRPWQKKPRAAWGADAFQASSLLPPASAFFDRSMAAAGWSQTSSLWQNTRGRWGLIAGQGRVNDLKLLNVCGAGHAWRGATTPLLARPPSTPSPALLLGPSLPRS